MNLGVQEQSVHASSEVVLEESTAHLGPRVSSQALQRQHSLLPEVPHYLALSKKPGVLLEGLLHAEHREPEGLGDGELLKDDQSVPESVEQQLVGALMT